MNLSSVDIAFIVKELRMLIGAWFEKARHSRRDFQLIFRKPAKVKILLHYVMPSLLFIATSKLEGKSPLSQKLDTFLRRSRLLDISQLDSERIVTLSFSSGRKLIIELIPPGNIIALKDAKIVFAALEKKWADRELRAGLRYSPPKLKPNVFKIKKAELVRLLSATKKRSVITFLALELGLGGIYAEELCARASIKKELRPGKLTNRDIEKLIEELRKMLKEASPGIADGVAVPFQLQIFKGKRFRKTASFSEAVEKIYLRSKKSPVDIEIEHISKLIKLKRRELKKTEREIADLIRKAEHVYSNYQKVSALITKARAVIEKKGWHAVKKLPFISEANPKKKKIVLRL